MSFALHPVLLPVSICVVVIVPLYGVLLLNCQVKVGLLVFTL